MKKYLVTEHYEDRGGGDTTWETKEELPPGARVLTRGEVDKAITERYLTTRHQKKELLDELFPETP